MSSDMFLGLQFLKLIEICFMQVLPEIGYQLLHSYSKQIKDWGWICNIHSHNSETFRRYISLAVLRGLK
jgi:DNA mismatch repair protein MLH3